MSKVGGHSAHHGTEKKLFRSSYAFPPSRYEFFRPSLFFFLLSLDRGYVFILYSFGKVTIFSRFLDAVG